MNYAKENEWIFTFGCGQKNQGKCVRLKGTYDKARKKMFRLFGSEWAFQYPASEWEEKKNDPNRIYSLEVESDLKELL